MHTAGGCSSLFCAQHCPAATCRHVHACHHCLSVNVLTGLPLSYTPTEPTAWSPLLAAAMACCLARSSAAAPAAATSASAASFNLNAATCRKACVYLCQCVWTARTNSACAGFWPCMLVILVTADISNRSHLLQLGLLQEGSEAGGEVGLGLYHTWPLAGDAALIFHRAATKVAAARTTSAICSCRHIQATQV